ncbi:MAG: stage 0 sporulation family protein [Dehalococcoidia bacterium]|jgi:cell fate regulator YaaT (PSP1 superfamily)
MTEEPATPRRIAGVRFDGAGRVFYFDAKNIDLKTGQQVVVQTTHGSSLGRVVIAPEQVVAEEIHERLDPVLRVANDEDIATAESLRGAVHEDLTTARKKVEEHGLDMRLVGGDSNLEGSRLTLYFTAQQRVDFRSLVRDLSSGLQKRVQLLQVGERDRAKLTGDIGQCGYTLCCRSWLAAFPSISIRMAKEQDVPLNPSKISGVCGRLLCCLAYEHEQYRELRGKLPKVGQILSTPAGEAKLVAVHVLKQTVSLRMTDSLTVVDMSMEELRGQYGTTVRPAELVKEELRAAAEEAPRPQPTQQAAGGQSEGEPHRRRRRRGGRGRRGQGPRDDNPPQPS